jgi:hypothetical protein
MPFNKDDYTKPPYTNGLMDLTEEEILYIQAELKEIAESLGVTDFVYDVLLKYNSFPNRWDKGEWINQDTAVYCFYYVAPETEEEIPVGDNPIEEPIPTESTETEEEIAEEE